MFGLTPVRSTSFENQNEMYLPFVEPCGVGTSHSAGKTAQTSPIPQYFQTDYPDQMYGCGTVASNGCGITCVAMVATYLTGHTYTPDELARYFGGKADNNIARL